jgi:hypothetical protein
MYKRAKQLRETLGDGNNKLLEGYIEIYFRVK